MNEIEPEQQNKLEEIEVFLEKADLNNLLPIYEQLQELNKNLKLLTAKEFPQFPEMPTLSIPEVQRVAIEGVAELKGNPGEPGKDGKNGLRGPQGIPGKNGKDGNDGNDGLNGTDGLPGTNGNDGSADSPLQIVEKLSSLEDSDRLPISAIDGLAEQIDSLKKLDGSKAGYIVSSHGVGGGIVKAYDLSNSLDGITTTFSLPAFWRIISVHLSSIPNICRPDIDYTSDGALMQITFTSQINAATSLSVGQTLLIIYAET